MKFFIAICFLLSGLEGFSQNLSNRGKEFWVGYGHHQYMEQGQSNSQEMILYFSAEQAANVTVTINGTSYVQNYSIPANSVIQTAPLPKAGTNDCRLYSLPWPLGNGGEGTYNRGIHIVSDVPIVAYAHIYGSASSGATMLMPVETWGYVYTSLNSMQHYGNNNCFSWVYVVAKEDNTVVEIIPSAPTRNGRTPGVPFYVTLNKGQIYQVIGALISSAVGHDMTGTKVRSVANPAGECYPIALFSGSSRTYITCSGGSGSGGDNIMQQVFPFQAWGKRYLTAPTSNGSAATSLQTNIYRIAVKDPTTVVKRNGSTANVGPLINGYYYQFTSNTADYIEADKPILVAQYMASNGGCPNVESATGDPEMIYISPIEQAIKKIGFYRNTVENMTYNYLTLIIPTAGLPSLRIDGTSFFSHSYPHPNLPGYTVVIRRWSASITQCIVQSDSAFTAITYGLGGVESYGYNAGTMINNLSAISSIQNVYDPASPEHEYTCTGSPIKLSALMAYPPTNMQWRLSTLGSAITPNADVIDSSPSAVDTVIVNGLTYYKYTLPGTYTFNIADTFDIPIVATHPSIENCNNREEVKIQIIVKQKPTASFTIDHSGCTLDTIRLAGNGSSSGYTHTGWNWTLPNSLTSTSQDTALVLAPGVYTSTLRVVSTEGCIDDTTQTLTVLNKPTADFSYVPATICEGTTVTFTDTSSNTGNSAVTSRYWDFGNGNTVAAGTGVAETNVYDTYGSYTVKLVAKSSATCYSDTARKVITVFANPRLSFDYPAGCLPTNGEVQFNSTTTVPDGQTLNIYTWDFGDPNATPLNPNTSTLANPTHIYTQFGNYPITYTATTANGCTADTIVNATFNLRPTLAYPALTAVCENAVTYSIANASVTNGVTGTFLYRGPGVDEVGLFTPGTAGPGTHTIWYVFTSTAGCADSISQTITVNAKPMVDFTYPAGGCLDVTGLVQFNNESTIADAQTLAYVWNFGDPNATPGNPNTSTLLHPTHNYLQGTYNISLTVNSSNGCTDVKNVSATFSLRPQLNWPALAAVCQNNTPLSVATATVTNGVTGTPAYRGPGLSQAGMFDPAVAGPGTHTLWYVFTGNGGCADSISQTITVHAKPMVDFTYTGGCLNVTGTVQFNNISTIADAQTLTYTWNFGDANATPGNPNTSNLMHPTHNFQPGSYNISLTVNSSNGCSDTKGVGAIFNLQPSLSWGALSPICESSAPVSVATGIVNNGVTGIFAYRGPGVTSNGMFNPAVAGPGTHTLWYIFTGNGGCADSVSQTILVHAKPRASFTFTQGCLDVNGLVQFTNNSTIADAQNMTYAWTFGDPFATGGNPNTSALLHPTHNYREGTYNIILTANSANGCVDDTTVSATFGLKPLLNWPALTAICANNAVVSVATATATNFVTGNGVYSGPGTSANGSFNPTVAGAGTHTLKYVYTATGGCKDSITQTITVHAVPAATFTLDKTDVCLGDNVLFTDASNITTGNIVSWNWNYGDGTTEVRNNATPFTHTYNTGSISAPSLSVVSDNGCISTIVTRPLTVRPIPVADFNMPAGVCMPNGSANFINKSTVSDNGALTYQWNFGDAGGVQSTLANPSHVYAASSSYNVTLTTTSAYGCAHDSIKVFSAFFDKPVAMFGVSPDTLCQGADNTFSDQSFAPNSTIESSLWNFGDNTTSTSTNPVKRYSKPGNYNVTLTVKNAVGCESDPYTQEVVVYLQPVIDAGPSFVVPQGTTIKFNPTANDSSVLTFRWTPAGDFTDPNILRPTLVAMRNQRYTLTATGQGNCSATDDLTVTILRPVKVPNAFSPNGDGINDKWVISNLADYPGASVEVYNRYGQLVFKSSGYANPWDGNYNGKPLPLATYYYVIHLKNGFEPLTGSVTIVK